MVAVVPIYGLGNRIWTIAAGVLAAEALGVPLAVGWKPGPGCYGAYEDLFDREFLLIPDGFKPAAVYGSRTWDRRIPRSTDFPIRVTYWGSFHVEGVPRTQEEFSSVFQTLSPKFSIQQKASDFGRAHHLCDCVGVHLRRTDNAVAKKKSPTPAFIDAMEQCPGSTKFFVCSDDPREEVRLQAAFPGRVVSRPLNRSRAVRGVEGLTEAIIDMLCLASTQRVLGNKHSTFSRLAAVWGNVELKLVG